MKTADEKAVEFIEKWRFYNFSSLAGELAKLLKEQDRDTRHACAEAVLKCNEDLSGECIWKDDAHAACMNARAL